MKYKYKAGLYRFERGGDLFTNANKGMVEGCNVEIAGWGETREIRLTEKELNALFKNQLFQRLGFVGWTYLGE